MKLSVAIAGEHALPSAFVVFRGFEKSIQKAAELGFNGVELALRRAEEINPSYLRSMLDVHGIEVSCISTGQVYADGGLRLTHENIEKRNETVRIFKELIDLAAEFGQIVNIGRVRGSIGNKPRGEVEALFVDVAQGLCTYALKRDVTLILEPVNRYEIDFIVSVKEGVALMKKIGMPNMMLMPDVFHMNIEDVTIGPELAKHIDHIKYIHIADSNRLAPGQGHLDFKNILDNLLQAGYDGWLSLEILPDPDPDTAARQAADFVLPLIKEYNALLERK
ncbi:sugar phosphate isomerase/epimerase family protein [Parapedobacter pyrenivorans]|uniref:sugar phosphate isomerase/epimerase family protein n=1 Tax=Parapedobacter pyrenivorans TaxID=1305674 RepID=UPI0033409FC6